MCPIKPVPLPDNFDADAKSKSQIKREALALKDLGKQLVELPLKSLEQIPLSESTREAVLEAKRLSRGALQRQLRHIGGLIPNEDVAAIRETLVKLRQPHHQQVREFQQLERWRDRLLAGDNAVMDELAERFADIDRQHLRQLLRNAQREREQNKPPKSARLLFQYLAELQNRQPTEE